MPSSAEGTNRTPSRAFVPAHVTGIFTVHRTGDPETSGSRGAGLALDEGLDVRVAPADASDILFNGEPTAVDAVERVLEDLGVQAVVNLTTELPLGAGFGLSGAMALGSALALNDAFDLGYAENGLIRLAHVADVSAGTGLGDVVAAARGGAPIRLEPGPPPHGSMDGIPGMARVEYLTFGELSTPEVLDERPERITEAGQAALEDLLERPTLPHFVRRSREFAENTGLLTDDLREVIDAVEANGGQATMGMLGQTVVALGTDLTEAGFDPGVTRIHPGGATVK